MTYSEFLAIFSTLESAFPHSKPTSDTAKVYYLTLQDIPSEVLRAACLKALTDSEFLPTIAKIRACAVALMTGESKSGGEAWGEMLDGMHKRIGYAMPDYADPLIKRTIAAIGWEALRMWETDDFATRAQFIKVYESLVKRAELSARELPQVAAVGERYRLQAQSTMRLLAEKLSVKQ